MIEDCQSPAILVNSCISSCSLSVFFSCMLTLVRCTYTKDYVFLEYWPLYHYVMPVFIPDNFSCSDIYCVWINIAISAFFVLFTWLDVSMIYFSSSLYFFLHIGTGVFIFWGGCLCERRTFKISISLLIIFMFLYILYLKLVETHIWGLFFDQVWQSLSFSCPLKLLI